MNRTRHLRFFQDGRTLKHACEMDYVPRLGEHVHIPGDNGSWRVVAVLHYLDQGLIDINITGPNEHHEGQKGQG